MDVGGASAAAAGGTSSTHHNHHHHPHQGASGLQSSPTTTLPPLPPQPQQHYQQHSPLLGYSPTAPQSAYRSPNGHPGSFVPISAAAPAPSTAPASSTPTNGTAPQSTTQNPRQRSSIACLHCRRSKIRCVNTGIDTTCNACRNTGRECKYSVEIFKRSRVGDEDSDRNTKRSKSRRSDLPGLESGARGGKVEGAGSDGMVHGAFYPDVPSLLEDGTLDPNVLTPDVWSQLYEIFETHFGTDLPFLHSPTFLKRLRESPDLHPRSDVPQEHQKNTDPEKVPGWELLVLGILMLTARFHPKLVEHLCAGKDKGGKDLDPIYASEHYALVLRILVVGSKGSYIGIPDIAKVQALLMLGLYEWGACKGIKAWLHVGLATRMAQAMGLQYEDDKDIQPLALSSSTRIEALHLELGEQNVSVEPLDPTSSRAFVEEEMRRRTFWSCFILDRYLSSGKYRPSMLMLDDLRIQLPSSQNAFLFGDRICTEYMDGQCSGAVARTMRKVQDFRQWLQRTRMVQNAQSENHSKGFRDPEAAIDVQLACETGPTESALSLHVRMVEIWGRIARWSCAGGISNEKYAPWHPSSDFYRLRESLSRFQNGVGRLFRLSKSNIEAHIAQHTISAYSLLQVISSFSVIILHRELVPFVPIRCNAPQGPFVQSQWTSEPPAGFYTESARQLFKAARDVVELIEATASRIPFPETPVAGFGLYQVAFIEVYAMHFPHMDPDGFVSGKASDANPSTGGVHAAKTILEIIADMRRRLPMADNWFRTIHRVNRYYDKIMQETGNGARVGLPNGGLQLQSANSRVGLDALDRTFKELGSAQDEDVDGWTGVTASSPGVAPKPGSEESKRPTEGWNPVNGINDAGHRPPSSGHYPGDSKQYAGTPPHAMAQPPGLSRGSTPTPSTSSLSPYQAPCAAAPYDSTDSHQLPNIYQQLAHASSNHAPTSWASQHQAGPNSGRQLPPLAPSGAQHTPTSSFHDSRPKSPLWRPDLAKCFSGDDVAAFMDGLSCQQWAESVSGVHPTWGIKGGGWKGLLDSEERGWLGRVWRG